MVTRRGSGAQGAQVRLFWRHLDPKQGPRYNWSALRPRRRGPLAQTVLGNMWPWGTKYARLDEYLSPALKESASMQLEFSAASTRGPTSPNPARNRCLWHKNGFSKLLSAAPVPFLFPLLFQLQIQLPPAPSPLPLKTGLIKLTLSVWAQHTTWHSLVSQPCTYTTMFANRQEFHYLILHKNASKRHLSLRVPFFILPSDPSPNAFQAFALSTGCVHQSETKLPSTLNSYKIQNSAR